jgi:hypothetical protein
MGTVENSHGVRAVYIVLAVLDDDVQGSNIRGQAPLLEAAMLLLFPPLLLVLSLLLLLPLLLLLLLLLLIRHIPSPWKSILRPIFPIKSSFCKPQHLTRGRTHHTINSHHSYASDAQVYRHYISHLR